MAATDRSVFTVLQDTEQKHVLLFHPPQYETPRIINLLLSQNELKGRSALIMTNTPEVYTKISNGRLDGFTNPYSDTRELQVFANSKSNRFLIIDDPLVLVKQINSLAPLIASKGIYIIIVGSLGITQVDLAILRTQFVNPLILVLTGIDVYPISEFKLVTFRMTPTLTTRYRQRVSVEKQDLKSSDPKLAREAREKIRSRREDTYEYPSNIFEQILANSGKGSSGSTVRDIPTSSGGWMTVTEYNSLNERSPKLVKLFSTLSLLPSQRHVVYTKFRHHYGSDLISTLMDYAGIKHVTIDGDDKEQDRVAKISRFNSGEVNVLVTTLIPKPDILGVSTLHLVEGVEESLFEKLIRKFLRWNLAQNVRVLSVYFYVGYEYNTNDETTDAELYRQVHFKYNTLVQAYDEIVRGAVQVKYSPKHGLVV